MKSIFRLLSLRTNKVVVVVMVTLMMVVMNSLAFQIPLNRFPITMVLDTVDSTGTVTPISRTIGNRRSSSSRLQVALGRTEAENLITDISSVTGSDLCQFSTRWFLI